MESRLVHDNTFKGVYLFFSSFFSKEIMNKPLGIHNVSCFSSTLAVLYHGGDYRLDDTKLGPKVHFSPASCTGTESHITLCDNYVFYDDCSATSEVSLVCSGKLKIFELS